MALLAMLFEVFGGAEESAALRARRAYLIVLDVRHLPDEVPVS